MKKLLLTTLMVAGMSFSAAAQEKGNVEFGVNSGVNLSNVSNVYVSGDMSVGFNAALSADYYFSDMWSIKVKAIYDRKGWDNGEIYEFSYDPIVQPAIRTDFNLDYVTVPVQVGFHFGGKRNFYLNTGPYIGFLVNAKETEMDTDLKEGFSNVDFGLSFGAGFKYPVSDYIKIFTEFEMQGGVIEIFDERSNDALEITTNSRYSFNIGINFLL